MARLGLAGTGREAGCGTYYWWVAALAALTVIILGVAVVHGTRGGGALTVRFGTHSVTVLLEHHPSSEADEATAHDLPCKDSGYCSLGISRVWRGDVATNEALREMLEAVSYKKEIIFSVSDLNGYQLEIGLNVVLAAHSLGYGHAVLLSYEAAGCYSIPTPLNETVSCIWDSRPIVQSSKLDNIYTKRWEFFARVVRMGFNALSLDGDTMIVADFYSYVKSPPFSSYNLLTQDDGGGVNCGVVYIQNAHPSGPTAWAALEHPYRTNRQRENQTHMQSVYKDWNFGDTWEQPFWNQVVGSVTNGKPYHQLGNDRSPEEWRQENGGYSLHSRRQHLNISWPPEWRNRTGIEFGPLQTVHNLTLPVVDDAWWQRYSKYFYPPEEGELSDRFFKLVRDSVDQPLFQLGKPWTALGLPEENFAFFPCWFTCAYAFRGWPGYWDLKPPAAVVLHDVYIPAHSGDWKMYTFKGINLFQWEATEAVRGHNVLGLPDPKLLMLAPGVQLYSQTEQTFLEDVKQLVRLADMMGRQLVVPNPPCDSMWVGVWRNQEQTWLPVWEYNYEGIQVLQFYDRLRPGNHTYCHWIRSVERRCTEVAPAYADTVAFLERWPNREQATPTERNTLWHAEWQAAGGAAGPPPSPPAVIVTPRPEIAVANAEAVVEAAAAFADWTVLFLGAVPKLGSASTLRPLSDQHKQCWLFADPPPQLDPLGSAGESRQRWLNGTL